ncbi:hypothetical protein P7C73_g4942, partial [Tremellales sp. Uapishka_1]
MPANTQGKIEEISDPKSTESKGKEEENPTLPVVKIHNSERLNRKFAADLSFGGFGSAAMKSFTMRLQEKELKQLEGQKTGLQQIEVPPPKPQEEGLKRVLGVERNGGKGEREGGRGEKEGGQAKKEGEMMPPPQNIQSASMRRTPTPTEHKQDLPDRHVSRQDHRQFINQERSDESRQPQAPLDAHSRLSSRTPTQAVPGPPKRNLAFRGFGNMSSGIRSHYPSGGHVSSDTWAASSKLRSDGDQSLPLGFPPTGTWDNERSPIPDNDKNGSALSWPAAEGQEASHQFTTHAIPANPRFTSSSRMFLPHQQDPFLPPTRERRNISENPVQLQEHEVPGRERGFVHPISGYSGGPAQEDPNRSLGSDKTARGGKAPSNNLAVNFDDFKLTFDDDIVGPPTSRLPRRSQPPDNEAIPGYGKQIHMLEQDVGARSTFFKVPYQTSTKETTIEERFRPHPDFISHYDLADKINFRALWAKAFQASREKVADGVDYKMVKDLITAQVNHLQGALNHHKEIKNYHGDLIRTKNQVLQDKMILTTKYDEAGDALSQQCDYLEKANLNPAAKRQRMIGWGSAGRGRSSESQDGRKSYGV